MGTKKFPVENAHNVYLSSHSGASNAYTGATLTNYYFDIVAKLSNGKKRLKQIYPPYVAAWINLRNSSLSPFLFLRR